MIDAERLLEVAIAGRRAVVLTVLEGPAAGRKALTLLDGPTPELEGDLGLPGLADLVERARLLQRPTVLEHAGARVLADVQGTRTRLVVVGAYDVADELCAIAARLGWTSVVVDARERFATRERLPSAGEIVVGWPREALAGLGLDAATAVVVLTHDHKFDVPAIAAALESDAFYVGALGSRRNQERRRPRLLEAGVDPCDLERVEGPAGLDLGGETPAETALSIAAQVVARRNGRTGGPLSTGRGRIHGPPGGEGSPGPGAREGADRVWATTPAGGERAGASAGDAPERAPGRATGR